MNKIVQSKIKESRHAKGNRVVPLKEALQAVFSRSNTDGMIEKILSPLRAELDDQESWEKSLKDLTTESLQCLKNPKQFKSAAQLTYLIFLDNMITELLQNAAENEFEKNLLKQIRDADISVSKEAAKERTLRMMKKAPSPSEVAEKILLAHQEKK